MNAWLTERKNQFQEAPTTINSYEGIKNGEVACKLSHWCILARPDLQITGYKYKLIIKRTFENCV